MKTLVTRYENAIRQARPDTKSCTNTVYMYVISLSNISIKANFKQITRVEIRLTNVYNTLRKTTFCAWRHIVSGLACRIDKPHHNSSLSRLVVILVHTTGSTWYKVLYHHTVYNRYYSGGDYILCMTSRYLLQFILLLCLRCLHWRVFPVFQ
jgi:hypothetical protein